ncbi:MAG: AAA family ATPase [Candidatus Hydrogenedentes bacterium]|nr:AAA family ATPase [Candidatus Hydrogenedentota bacterium]
MRRIVLRPQFLDDEKLPEAERVHALREVFNRNIRLKQLERLANAMSSILAGALPPNILIYGPTGTGKSVTCLHFLSSLAALCDSQSVRFRYFYLDLTTPKTCFGALNELAIALDGSVRRYRKGIALEHIQETIITALAEFEGTVCVLIDEIDNITFDADVFLTFLVKTLPKRVPPGLCFVFLTNRLSWDKNLDPRLLSVLKKQDMIFEPYDALDLMEILRLRVEKALDPARVEDGAVRKIAAYASRETGDARKAVELLAKAVKVAEETSGRLTEREVDVAEHSLEIDKTEELIGALAVQQRLALKGCYAGLTKERKRLSTGSAFVWYQGVCEREGTRALTQRRFSDMVSFLDLYGLINARAISKGRYGKTRELSSALSEQVVHKILR